MYIYESEAHNSSAGFLSAHAPWSRLFSVHFKVLHATVANSANKQVSWGVRSLVFIYFSIALKKHHFALEVVLKNRRQLKSREAQRFFKIKILRRGKPPWLAFFLPNAKI